MGSGQSCLCLCLCFPWFWAPTGSPIWASLCVLPPKVAMVTVPHDNKKVVVFPSNRVLSASVVGSVCSTPHMERMGSQGGKLARPSDACQSHCSQLCFVLTLQMLRVPGVCPCPGWEALFLLVSFECRHHFWVGDSAGLAANGVRKVCVCGSPAREAVGPGP